jgi:HD-GYP domain-containing protein (c-di-GMP phosphodiesterase class II)
MDTIVSYLTSHPFFYSLGSKDILAFSSFVHIESYPPSSIIIRQGEVSDSIYMIMDGHVVISRVDEGGGDLIIAQRGVGEIMGELSVLKGEAAIGTVKAVDPVIILKIEGSAFRRLVGVFPDVREKMERLIVQRSAVLDFYETDYEEYVKKKSEDAFEMDPAVPYLLIQLNDAAGGSPQLEHCKEVAFLSREISRIMCPAVSETIYLAGLLHEIGKLSLPEGLAHKVRKKQPLTPEEKLRSDEIYQNALEILKPDVTLSEQISFLNCLNRENFKAMPLEAQILKVANDYLEMVDKNYQGIAKVEALQRLKAGSDTCYNPRIIKALEEVFDNFHTLRVNNQINFIRMINIALDAKYRMNIEHTQSTATLALMLGRKISLSREQLDDLKLGCELHNVGMIYVPTEILNAPRKLEEDEFELIKQHPGHSAAFFQNVSGLEHLCAFIRHHHERMDGKGYPHGIAGDEIPLFSRILKIADAFNALREPRPYRLSKKGEPIVYRPQMALIIMSQMQPGAFDQELLTILKDMLKFGELKDLLADT